MAASVAGSRVRRLALFAGTHAAVSAYIAVVGKTAGGTFSGVTNMVVVAGAGRSANAGLACVRSRARAFGAGGTGLP